MDVRLPDGTIIKGVPDGMSKADLTAKLKANGYDVSRLSAPAEPAPDPTDGMSSGEKRMAGVGQGAMEVWRAAKQGDAMLRRLPVPTAMAADWLASKLTGKTAAQAKAEADAEIADARQTDAALLATPEGRQGSFAGKVAAVAPAILAPGANTYLGAAAIGAGTGAVTTEGDAAARLKGGALGAVGGIVGKAGGDLIAKGAQRFGQARQASLQAQKAANATRDNTLRSARASGYVVTPSQAGAGGVVNRLAEGLGGKIKTQQTASVKNQEVTDRLVRQSLGLPDDAPLTPETFAGLRQQAGQAYEALRGLGTVQADADLKLALQAATKQAQGASRSFPGLVKQNPVDDIVRALDQPSYDAGDAIDAVRVLRDQADSFYANGDKAAGKAVKGIAAALEDSLERAAQQAGDPALVQGFREARKLIAKSYTVQGALNQGAGTVSAPKLAAQLAKGRPLSGELKEVAQFAQAFPKAAQSGVDVPAFSPLDVFSGGLGLGMQNPALVALTAARPVARTMMLTPFYQRAMVNPQPYTRGLLERAAEGLLTASPTRKGATLTSGLLAAQAGR